MTTDIHPFGFLTREELHDWADQHKHPAWFIPNLIPVDGVTIVYGDGGSGKSRILLEACLYLEAGLPFCGNPAFSGPYEGVSVKTAWLSFEDAWAWEMDQRLTEHPIKVDGPLFLTRSSWDREPDIADRLRLSMSKDFIKDGILNENSEANWLALGEALAERDVKVLVVDATKGLVGGQVSRQEIADAVIELFAKIRRQFGITTVLIAHSSAHKKDHGKPSDEVMGASTWVHSARHVVLVQSSTTTTFARVTKSNWGPTGFNVKFKRVSDRPVAVQSINTTQEYAAQQNRKRTHEHFAKRTANLQKLIEAGKVNPEIWKSFQSMADAININKSVIQRMKNDGWLEKSESTGCYRPVPEKMNWSTKTLHPV
jgi:hypothetical protein